jgi:hypothetical protein
MVNSRVWSFVQPPWEKHAGPTLEAVLVKK